jgi:hypothetical protein
MHRPYMNADLVKRSRTMTAFLKHNCQGNLCFDDQGYTTLEELSRVMHVGPDPILQIVAISRGRDGLRFETAEWAEGVKLIRSCVHELPPGTDFITRLPKPSQTKCERLMTHHLATNRGHLLSFDRDGYVSLDALAHATGHCAEVILEVVALSVEHGRRKFEVLECEGQDARVRLAEHRPEPDSAQPGWPSPSPSPALPALQQDTEVAVLLNRVNELETQVSRLQYLCNSFELDSLIERVEALEGSASAAGSAHQDPCQATATSHSPSSSWDLRVTVRSRLLGWSDTFLPARDFILCPGDAILLLGPLHDDMEGEWRLVQRACDGVRGWILTKHLPTWPEF